MTKRRKTSGTKKLACLIHGASGRMGKQLIDAISGDAHFEIAGVVDEREIQVFDEEHTAVLKNSAKALSAVLQGTDVIIDFSSPKGTAALIKALDAARGKTVLIGTTGLEKKHHAMLLKVANKGQHKVLLAGNTSLGVATMAKLASLATTSLHPAGFDVEIVETHHRMKADAPSGTALLLAKMIQKAHPKLEIVFNRSGKREQNTVGIHAIRGGGVVGEHSIRFISDSEELSISHRAFSRTLFAKGALHLAFEIDKTIAPGQTMELADYLLA